MPVYKLKNGIQNYAWGSAKAIPELLGYDNNENQPMAELWMGAHPKMPSKIITGSSDLVNLDSFIEESPEKVLGSVTAERFGNRLPFLFKVLAAGSPLSIQAHPNLAQAAEGYRREDEAGIAHDAFNRNYKDDNHKPEIICALTEFHAMRGFRPAAVIASNFRKILIPDLEAAVIGLETVSAVQAAGAGTETAGAALLSAVSGALRNFFTEIMQLDDGPRKRLLAGAALAAEAGRIPEARWIKMLAELYPGDIGILSPLYLNVISLQAGQAMFLPAGELHAYLDGLGIELMANSDNVLRGGLTPKYVDVPELLATLNFSAEKPDILTPEKITGYESVYRTAADEFILSKIELDGKYTAEETQDGPAMPSILLCLEGSAEVSDSAGIEGSVTITRGESAFVAHGAALELNGAAVLYRASVPFRRQG